MNKYFEIFRDLKKRILSGTYKAGDLLPSENILAKEYHVSRETIRKALVLLTENGFIQKMQGKGSIVLNIARYQFPISGLVSYKELEKTNQLTSKTIVSKLTSITISKNLSKITGFPENKEAWLLIRQRKIEDEIIILDTDVLLKSIVPKLPISACEDSLYEYLEKELNLVISYAQKEFTVEAVTKEDQNLMDLSKSDTHVVVVKSHVHLEDTRLFQYTESRHRLDKFRFVDFARRHHPNNSNKK